MRRKEREGGEEDHTCRSTYSTYNMYVCRVGDKVSGVTYEHVLVTAPGTRRILLLPNLF